MQTVTTNNPPQSRDTIPLLVTWGGSISRDNLCSASSSVLTLMEERYAFTFRTISASLYIFLQRGPVYHQKLPQINISCDAFCIGIVGPHVH